MAASSRFAVAVHILTFLAADRSRPQTSEGVANSVGTNPTVVRRLISDLARAGLVESRLGKGGGSQLSRGPKKISLLEIYQAVEDGGLAPLHRSPPSPSCPVGGHIQPALKEVIGAAEAAFFKELAGHTLKDMVRRVRAAA
ncbi:MAG: Rrf2 family transcriptional regulator [Hyphococcus sp.]